MANETKRIAVVSQPLLDRRYGASAPRVTDAVKALAGTRVVVSAGVDAAAIRKDVQPALREAADGSILLVGGVATMPFFELPLPGKKLDADALVPTDNPYGVPGTSVTAIECALPARPVGRIPDHPDDTAETFAARIAALCLPLAPEPGDSPYYFLSTQSWQGTSATMAGKLAPAPPLDLAPPRAPDSFASPPFVPATARRFVFNLHGSDRAAAWFGEIAAGGQYPPAFDPAAVSALAAANRIAGALVLSQACYGAFLLMPGGLRRRNQACSLQFLEHGAAAFVGSTTIAYGGTTGAMTCSDVLAVELFRHASNGVSLGRALLRARATVAAAAPSPPPGAILKTLLQFVLYGDPERAWAKPPPSPKAALESLAPSVSPDLGLYRSWSEEAVPVPKALESIAVDPTGWTEVARFTGPTAPRPALARSAAPAMRRVYRRVARHAFAPAAQEAAPLAAPPDVVYFRETATYGDGSTFEAQSTGGRAVLTLAEEADGATAWWRHGLATPPTAAAPRTPAKAKGKAKRQPARRKRSRTGAIGAPGRAKPPRGNRRRPRGKR